LTSRGYASKLLISMMRIAENETALEESLRWLAEAVTESSRAGDRKTLRMALDEIGLLSWATAAACPIQPAAFLRHANSLPGPHAALRD